MAGIEVGVAMIPNSNWVLVLSLALTCVGGPVVAQPPETSPQKLKLAEEYVNQTTNSAKLEQGMAMLGVLMGPSIPSDATPEFAAAMRQARQDSIPALVEHMKRSLVAVAAETYTEDELKALVDFQNTPLGRSAAQKQQDLIGRPHPAASYLGQAFTYEILSRTCAKVVCAEEIRSVLEASKP